MIDNKEVITFIRQLYQEPYGFIPLHAPIYNGNEKKYLEELINAFKIGVYSDSLVNKNRYGNYEIVY